MDFRVRPRYKTPKSGVAHCKLSPYKKARMSKSKIKSMLFLTVSGSSTRNLCHQDKQSIKLFIGKSLKDSEKGATCATRHCTHLDAAPRQRPMSHGSLHQSIFGRKTRSCGSSAPPIRLISVPVTFYSPGSKTT